MGETLSPRVDAAAKSTPKGRPRASEPPLARADGLSVEDALKLVAWLKQAGYRDIEVIEDTDTCSVVWHR